ncbi:SUZ RNA-binding domain-containing-like [Mytilus edulis]|uniref:SUZ RNA-binding domain-containing-like n=1 Tax=Mytilus edulis TaxID=6550 RepID=UPI0039EE5521
MNTDESDLVGDVLDSWEELEDNTVLDKKLKEIKTSADEKKSFPAQGMVTDSSDRTQYQPQVKIMKRPTDTPSTNNDKRSNIPTKTLEQREAEYAEARLRILGPAYGNGDGNEEEPQENIAEERVTQLFKELNTNNNCVEVLRQPKGPDGTPGFDFQR